MKCTACGADLVEGAKFCEYCGTPVAAAPAPEPVPAPAQADAPKATPTLEIAPAPKAPEPEVAAAPAQQTYTYQQPQNQAPQQPVRAQAPYVQPEAAQPQSNKLNVWSLVLGISSLGGTFTFVWWPFVGLIAIGISIAGLVVSGKAKRQNPNKMARTGFLLSLIGLILSILLTIIMTIVWLVALSNRVRFYY